MSKYTVYYTQEFHCHDDVEADSPEEAREVIQDFLKLQVEEEEMVDSAYITSVEEVSGG